MDGWTDLHGRSHACVHLHGNVRMDLHGASWELHGRAGVVCFWWVMDILCWSAVEPPFEVRSMDGWISTEIQGTPLLLQFTWLAAVDLRAYLLLLILGAEDCCVRLTTAGALK